MMRLAALLFTLSVSAVLADGLRVIDGDTLAFGEDRVRLWGVAAPELHEAGGREARFALIGLIGVQRVTCEGTGARSYGRTVARCYVGGEDLGALMVANGFARDCPRYSGGAYAVFEIEKSRALPLPDYCEGG